MHTENGPGLWTAPQCPFLIEYSQRVLDDIRLAVMDAFFSLPRGGAEIGGILLGRYDAGRVIIGDHRALECEHAFGPGFTLSDRDKNLLAHLLAGSMTRDLEPVGWYHSHTRSEIFLSEADLAIHDTYFPESWQIALVIKPHTFHPARGGFFFREPGGSIHAAATYREFQLEPLGVRQVPTGVPPLPMEPPREPVVVRPPKVITVDPHPFTARPAPVHSAPPEPKPVAPEIEIEPEVEVVEPEVQAVEPEAEAIEPEIIEPEAEAIEPETVEPEAEAVEPEVEAIEPEVEPVEPEVEPVDAEAVDPELEAAEAAPEEKPEEPAPDPKVPSFLQPEPPRSWKWLKVAAVIAIGAGLGSLAYALRDGWIPSVLAGFERLKGTPASAAVSAPLPPAPAAIGLSLIDNDGQLQVHWDRLSTSVRNGSHALLEILDSGAAPQALTLDEAHLESGIFTYARQGERIDVALAIDQPNGKRIRESTTFLGKLPDRPEDAMTLKRQRDDLARQNTQLQADLRTAAERARKAEKAFTDLETQIKQQQRRRLQNQVSK